MAVRVVAGDALAEPDGARRRARRGRPPRSRAGRSRGCAPAPWVEQALLGGQDGARPFTSMAPPSRTTSRPAPHGQERQAERLRGPPGTRASRRQSGYFAQASKQTRNPRPAPPGPRWARSRASRSGRWGCAGSRPAEVGALGAQLAAGAGLVGGVVHQQANRLAGGELLHEVGEGPGDGPEPARPVALAWGQASQVAAWGSHSAGIRPSRRRAGAGFGARPRRPQSRKRCSRPP